MLYSDDMMKNLLMKITGVIAPFALVGLALSADWLETKYAWVGALLWMVFMVGSALLLILQAIRTKVSPAVCVVALIPFLNLVLVPLVGVILAFLPTKNRK